MTKGWKRPVQGASIALVAVLLGITVWRIHIVQSKGHAAPKPDHGKIVHAPALTLRRLDAPGTFSLTSLREKVVVINFWASWCGPCREEAPLLERTWLDHRAKGLVVVGVDANDFSGDARRFAHKHGLTYPIVLDPHGSTLGRWGVPGLPTTFVVDREGRVVAKVVGGLRVGDNAESFSREVAQAVGQ